jgi:phosphoribosylformylglycinamidine synthase
MTQALVIRTAGTNCDAELMRAFELAGATPSLLHLDRLIEHPVRIEGFDIIAFPGGFSYGDDIASGRIFAMRVRERLYPALRDAARRGCPMIGVCNGFQVLVQVGLLPGPLAGQDWPEDRPPEQQVTLAVNERGMFIDEWVRVRVDEQSQCLWTRGLAEAIAPDDRDAVLRLPIAHGEGRFVARSADLVARLEREGRAPLKYIDNVNGSTNAIAGICDASGRVFGLMPHPERYLEWLNHPFWTRLDERVRSGLTPGLLMFRNAVEAAAAVRA